MRYNNRKENEALHYELGYPKWRENTHYTPCPKINRKNYEENRKKVLTLGKSVVL